MITQQGLDREFQRSFNEAADEQLMPVRIDVRYAAGMPLVVKSVRRDRTLELMKRSHGHAGAGSNILVSLIEGSQAVFQMLLGIIFTLFFPRLVVEDISKKALIIKSCSILLMILGIYLLNG